MGSIFSKLWNDMNQYYQSIQTDENKSVVDGEVSDDRSIASQTSLIGETCDRLDNTANDVNHDDYHSPSHLPQTQTPTHKCDAISQKLNSMKLSFEDPRSPTYGIERTPIELMLKYETLGDKLDAMRLSFGNASNITHESDEQSIAENN